MAKALLEKHELKLGREDRDDLHIQHIHRILSKSSTHMAELISHVDNKRFFEKAAQVVDCLYDANEGRFHFLFLPIIFADIERRVEDL